MVLKTNGCRQTSSLFLTLNKFGLWVNKKIERALAFFIDFFFPLYKDFNKGLPGENIGIGPVGTLNAKY